MGTRVIHIAAGLEKKTGSRPIVAVDAQGQVTIPAQYLALIGVSGGGNVRMIARDGGFVIERAGSGEPET
ncbi:MAG: AbrB/MazE/SpoVT family DNA-binding domain-containing protein [Firmicutes bacterium]|nr:AbrB/MazE/SpoVT family DNA-binding domain-containing protein [Bacillota bacterium]